MSTPTEPETTPPPPTTEHHNPIPPSIANNAYVKGALDNPYGTIATKHPFDVPAGIILMVLGGLDALKLLRAGFFLGGVLPGSFLFYVLVLIVCAAGLGLGGFGIFKGMRWGFMLAAAAGVLGLLFSALWVDSVSLVVYVVAAVYGFLRLTGQLKA